MDEKEVQKQIYGAKRQNIIILIMFIALTFAVILGVCVYKYQHAFSIEKWKISRKEYPSDTTLVYFLGIDYMDNEWLILSLDDGIVYEYCIDVS